MIVSETVLNSVREKCREALKAHIPIVYIKTDSSIFIQRLLESSPALVARVWSDGNESGKKPNELVQSDEKVKIVAKKSEGRTGNGNYLHITDECKGLEHSPREKEIDVLEVKNPQYPFIKAYQIPKNTVIEGLMNYIIRHEDPGDNCYDVLQNSLVILYSSQVQLNKNLLAYTNIIEVEIPKEDEIKDIIVSESENFFSNDDADNYSGAMLGLTVEEVVMLTKRIATVEPDEDDRTTDKIKNFIYEYKRQKMEGGCLEFCKSSDENVGGMALYGEWLDDNEEAITAWYEYEKKYGISPPKGVLFCGIPGCGKSAAAKFTAKKLCLTMVKLDIGTLMDKYQGEAERKMREALRICEEISPCVVWIDELEKGFSGANGNEDSSAFKRMFGYLLGWMQENKKPCFIFATANNIGGLPKEFFRTGRMDERFAVYVPLEEDCIDIFESILSKYKIPEECVKAVNFEDIIRDKLICGEKPRIVIGSDIEQAVKIALRKLNRKTITAKILEEELKNAFDGFTVYGDSEENIDSIAASYCRLLRKGMKPTTKNVLFDCKDYYVDNYIKLKEIKKQKETISEEVYNKKIKENSILKSEYRSKSRYNNLVHTVLKERINRVAYDIEEYERNILIRM